MFSGLYRTVLMLVTAALLAACGGGAEDGELRDISEELTGYYAAYPEFFTYATPEDVPDGLVWEDGMDLPDLGSPEARKGGTEYSSIQDFPRTLRHVGPDSNGAFRGWIMDNVTLGLAELHPDVANAFYPGLARQWAIDYDNRTVYARLDPEARWSDGVPVTADDYLFMFFFFQSEYIVAPWYNNYYGIGNTYTNITRYDEHTISITTAETKPDLPARVLSLRPQPQHFYRELGEDFIDRYQWRSVPVTSPYVVREQDINRGRSITISRIDNWWAEDRKFYRHRYNVDRIQFRVVRDTNNAFESFRRGDVDRFGLNLSEFWYDRLPDDDPDVQAGYIHKSVFYNQRPRPNYGLWINTDRRFLDDRNVRLGIQHATNFDRVIQSFYRGDGRRMDTARDGYGEFTHPDIVARPYDIEKAEEHFAEAGFTRRGPDGILVNENGQRLAFTVSTGYTTLRDVLTILREEAARAGIEFRIEVLDSTAGWQKVQEKQHDIHLAAFNVAIEMYPRFWDFYHSANAYDQAFLEDGSVNPDRQLRVQSNNLETFAVPEMDRMIERYDRSSDYDEMLELAYRMQELHHEHASFVPGWIQDFYRVGHWRWVRYPEFFNHRQSDFPGNELFIHWIDEEMKQETLAARRGGETFEPRIQEYDQFRLVE